MLRTLTLHAKVVWLTLAFTVVSPVALHAQPPGGKTTFGKANPFTLEELPDGSLKARIQTLPPQAKARAMQWLHTIDFHAFDAEKHLRADENGGIYIVCPINCDGCEGDHHHDHHHEDSPSPENKPAPIPQDGTTGENAEEESDPVDPPTPMGAPVPISSPPAFNSRPGSTRHVYLDFNGGIVTGKQWNSSYGVTSWDCKPYDKDGDPTTFSDFEQAEIRRIWERTVEDYSSFDINVTTDVFYDPATVGGYSGNRNVVGWCMITSGKDKNNVSLPHDGYGGVAYVNVWGRTDYFSTYQPAFTIDYAAPNATEANSHEFGHNLGLSHDGLVGASPAEYYGGHDAVTGVATSWGPIMGTGYGRNVSQWSKASEYLDGSQTQDDLAIISGKLTYRPDDHGGTFAAATVWNNATINQTGIIERTNDHDYFTFISGPGTITLNANAFRSESGSWGANLDILLELYNSNQNLIASHNPAADTNATISQTVTGGTYYLVVKPTGAGSPLSSSRNGYTVYGSLGQYTITGTIPDKQPEIVVEQPVSNSLTSGSATVNFGSVNLGSSSSPFTFTIRNTGQSTLSGLALSKSGTHSAEYTLGSLGATSLAPGASTTFSVTFTPAGNLTRNASLQIASNDLDENPFNINLTGTGVPLGTLAVTEGGFGSTGKYGGPFTPASKAYTLTNIGSTSIQWTAEKSAAWVNLDTTSGSLAPGASTVVTASLDASVNSLAIGSYSDTLTFTNTTNGNGNTTRNVDLTVTPIPVAIAISDLLQYFDGSPKPVTITTTPANKAFTVTYNGSPTPPTDAGSYNVAVTITEPLHTGSASDTLVVAYQVTYNGNGSTTGTAPAAQTKFLDTPITLATNSGNLLKTNATFGGWNTAPDGSGTDYPVGSSYAANQSLSLYAKWLSGGDGTWLPTTTGPHNWSTTTNWSGGNVGNGTDSTAFFTPNITANQTATLDTPRTIGNITFTDSTTSSNNLTISGTNTLTLSRTSGMPVVDVTQSGRQLTIATPITGSHGLQKDGPGIMDIRNASNNFTGGIVLNAGTLATGANAGSGHFGNNPITVNANATISVAGSGVNPTSTGITINNGSFLTIDTNVGQLTVNGNVTGTGSGISVGAAANTGSQTVNLNGTNNTFTGPIEFRTSANATNSANLNLTNLADSASPGQGNIRFGAAGATGNSVNAHNLNLLSAASQPLTLTNRRIELAGTTNSLPTINNNSAQALTINSDLLFSGGSSKLLQLGGTGAGLSNFAGEVSDSATPTTGSTVLAAAYATGATTIRLASVNGVSVGATITGPNIPAGTTITAINTGTSEVTISNPTTNSGSLGATITTSGVIGNLAIIKQGTGTWALTNPDNAFTGPIILNSTTSSAGTLRYASAAGTNPIIFNQTTSTATLSYTGAGQTMSGLIHAPALTSGTITLDSSGAGPVHYSNPDSLKLVSTSNTVRKLVLSGNNTGNNIFAGALTDNIGSTNQATLTKNGTGTWILTGENAHTGTTTVSAGKLFINGNHSSAAGNVSVAANATLGGTGIIGGNTTITASGRLEFDISTLSASHDKLELASGRSLTFSGASTLTITSSGGAAPGTYVLLTAPGGITGSAPASLILPTNWLATVAIVGNDLVLNVSSAAGPLPGNLDITPPDSLASFGLVGGPFTPSSIVYSLQNTGDLAMNWTAAKSAPWLTLSATSGSLAAGASTTVIASINSNANSLPEGYYQDTIAFTNTTNGLGNTTRQAAVSVTPPATYTISYDGNGNTGGSPPADQTKTENINLTLSEPGTLERSGYTFSLWNTASSGTGTNYAAGATYSANASAILYAQWSANTYAVTFDPNGGNAPNPTSKQVTFAATYGPLATVTRPGFVFLGWFTAPTGGTQVTTATTVTTASNHTLYAQWEVGNPEINITRGATQIPLGSFDPLTGTAANTATPLTYTISNTGNFDLTVGTAATAAASNCSATITTQPASTVAPAGNTNLALSVTPTAAGAWSVSVSLPNGDADENPYIWTVYGVAQGSATATFQKQALPNSSYAGVIDTYINGTNNTANTNYGNEPILSLFNRNPQNNFRHAFLRFDLSSIPANATVTGASLEFVQNNTVSGSVDVYHATGTWTETGATWNNSNSLVGPTLYGTANAPGSAGGNVPAISLNAAGRAIVQSWIDGTATNHGFALKTTNGGNNTNVDLRSSNHGTTAHRPKLTLTYATAASVAEMHVTRSGNLIADGSSDALSASVPGNGIPLNYTISNLGNADLTITTPISVSGAANCSVTVSNQPTSPVAAGTSTNLVLTVTPTVTGAWSANISITNNDPNEATYNWTISGTASGGFLVSYDANGATSGSLPGNQIKLQDVPLTLATNAGNLSRTGYNYLGWNTANDGSGTAYAEGTPYTANADLNLFAHWQVNDYTVTFDPNGGTTPDPTSKSVTFDSTYGSLPIITRTGHTFIGWFTDPIDGTEVTAATIVTIDRNHTLFARWTPNTYTVAFDANDGSSPSPATIEVTYGLPYGPLATTTRTGHTFNGWFTAPVGGNLVTAGSLVDITANQTLFAQWTANTYTVTFDANGGETPAPTSIEVTFGAPYGNLAATEREGYTFEGWFTAVTGGTLVTPATTVTAAENQTLYARWTANTYTVTFHPNGGDSPNPASKQVTFGSTYGPLATTARTGYTFNGWFTQTAGGVEITTATTVSEVADHTLYAQWTANTYAVTYDGNGNTDGSAPATQEKIHDTPLTLADNTGNLVKVGSTFAGWNTADDGTGTDYPAGSTYVENASITLYAKWIAGADGTWLPTAGGSYDWSGPANWVDGIVAFGPDRTALFAPDITGDQVANLDTERTIGNIIFTDSSSSSNNLTIAGTSILTLARTSGVPVIDVTQSDRNLTIASQISGTNGLRKNGAGTLTLSGSNDYTGVTTVHAGKLLIHGDQGTASGNLSVSANATLGGTGIIGGDTTIAGDGHLEFHISTSAASHDKLELATGKSLTFSGSSSLTITGTEEAAVGQYTLLTAPGGITGSAPAIVHLPNGWAATASISGNDLVLDVTTLPAGPVASFAIAGVPSQVTVGTTINNITITALDENDQVATGFTGTVTFGGTAGITGTSANFVAGLLTGVSITPGLAGSALTFTVNDGSNHTGTAIFDVLSLFEHWAAANGLTGPDADPDANSDRDSLNNLQEYAFGMNPNAGDSGPITYGGNQVIKPGAPTLWIHPIDENSTDFRAVFGRRKDYLAAGIVYTIEASADLDEWVPLNTAPIVIADQGSTAMDAVYVPYPPLIETSRGFEKPLFFRVGVSFTP